MQGNRKIETALISVYHKENLTPIISELKKLGVRVFSTGGTQQYLQDNGLTTVSIESLTGYPSILGGRVKTLHPKVFGGILARKNEAGDADHLKKYDIPSFDLVIVDLYPFQETLRNTNDAKQIIEKIDIGGISLIRAASKNFNDVIIVPASEYYQEFLDILKSGKGETTLSERKRFAAYGFKVSSEYDTSIYGYFAEPDNKPAEELNKKTVTLRYGENPHQTGVFHGDLEALFTQLHGKQISYNNILDIDSGLKLINEFEMPTIAILKHTNACGLASRDNILEAWVAALAGDPVSAFGGVIIANRPIDKQTAEEMDKIFFEIIIAPEFQKDALQVLQSKKNRIILQLKEYALPEKQIKTMLNGILEQSSDWKTERKQNLEYVTNKKPTDSECYDLLFANKIVKHTKSNAIVLAKDGQLIGSGTGQTSRVDALKQAISKAKEFGFSLQGAVMASDAFFPFADSIEIAHKAGIVSVIQPGGSVRDKDTIDYCNNHNISMLFTGTRHFKH